MVRLLALFFTIASSIVDATGLTVSERYEKDNNNRFVVGLSVGLHNVDAAVRHYPASTYGFGAQHIAGRFLHVFQPVDGLEIISSVNFGGGSYGKFLSKSSREAKLNGILLDTQLGLRYLHRINDTFDVGGQAFVGYGAIFAEALREPLKAYGLSWPAHIKIGPSARIVLPKNFTLYASAMYTLSGIGTSSLETKIYGKTIFGGVNKHGLEIPIGFTYAFNQHFSLFTEVDFEWRDFQAKNASFLSTINIGCSVDFFR